MTPFISLRLIVGENLWVAQTRISHRLTNESFTVVKEVNVFSPLFSSSKKLYDSFFQIFSSIHQRKYKYLDFFKH